MINRKELTEQIERLGLPWHSAVLVHTSLRAVGAVEGGGEGLLDALIEACMARDTLLLIPTHTWALHGKEEAITLDLGATYTNLGTFPTLALRDGRGIRTVNPTHSMAVFGDGEKARAFAALDERFVGDTPAPPEGCYEALSRMGGVTLLVGVGLDKYTYMHAVEEKLGVPDRNPPPADATVRYPDGRVVHHPISTIAGEKIGDVSHYFPKYEPPFRKYGVLRDGVLGEAKVMIADAAKTEEVMALIRRRSGGIELLGDGAPIPTEYYEE